MRVVATKIFATADRELLQKELPDVEFYFPQDVKSLASLDFVADKVDMFLGPPPPPAIIDHVLDTLKLIQIPWAGVDGIDFSHCRKRGVLVANSHTNARSVAELAVCLCLDALKLTPFHDSGFRHNRWHRPGSPEGFYPPRLLRGLTVGYLGFGSIAQEIHRLLSGFDLKSVAITHTQRVYESVKMYNRNTQFEEFLQESEILFVTAPLTNETRGIINEEAMRHLKNTCVLVNVARAELIEPKALHTALVNNKISSAALDVHWQNLSAVNVSSVFLGKWHLQE